MRDSWDDERLLAALSEALKASQAVPSWFVETGKNAFAWHNIDAELTGPLLPAPPLAGARGGSRTALVRTWYLGAVRRRYLSLVPCIRAVGLY